MTDEGYILYADIYFLINFCMDFLSLFVCAKILHRKVSNLRMIFASALGAFYAVLLALFNGFKFYNLIIVILVGILMCFITYGYHSAKRFFTSFVLFFAVSLLFGGIMNALYSLYLDAKKSGSQLSNGLVFFADRFSVGHFMVLCVLAVGLTLLFGRVGKEKQSKKSSTVCATLFGTSVTFEGLVDSGNLLREPISSRPVIIINRKIASELIPGASHNFSIVHLSELNGKLVKRLRVIPTSSVGGSKIMTAIICDKLTVDGIPTTACLGIDPSTSEFGGYNSLIPAVLLS